VPCVLHPPPQAAQTRGVAVFRCNELDKRVCDTRSCIDFGYAPYGDRVDEQGHPTSACAEGHSANAKHHAASSKVLARFDLRAGGSFDKWLARAKGQGKAQDLLYLLGALKGAGFGGEYECAEDLLAFEAKGDDAQAGMAASVAAWARLAAHVGACPSEKACDAAAIQRALQSSGHARSYAVPDTCDTVYNCDELKEQLLRKGTPAAQKMFRPQAALHD